MAWHSLAGMGSNQGSGSGGTGDVQTAHNQPQGTEYTLQGVMRFLQTEWHRHERDRNSWEIERQEMKGRIAKLEGSTRKSDAGNRALKKYVDILEIALKDRDKLVKELRAGKDVTESVRGKKEIGSRAVKEKQRSERSQGAFLNAPDTVERLDEDPDRESLKAFLDKAQAEVTYLMVSPSNPLPPRETSDDLLSLPLGINSGQSDPGHIYQPQTRQRNVHPDHLRSSSVPNHHPPQVTAPKITRDLDFEYPLRVEQPTPQSPNQGRTVFQKTENSLDDHLTKIGHNFDHYGRETNYEEEKGPKIEANGWDFNETDAFPEAETKPHRPDTDSFPAAQDSPKSPNLLNSNRRKGSLSRRKCSDLELLRETECCEFKVRFGLRGHLDAVRCVIFTGGGSPGQPEICTTGDDGTIKRWIIPARYENQTTPNDDIDIQSNFTHRGHSGSVMCLTSWSPSQNFSGGGRAQGDGWVFSGGQDATIRVWERGRIGPKAVMHGHNDAVWAVCVLPGTLGSVLGQKKGSYGESDRILIASGSADGSVKVWSVSAPPQSICLQVASRKGSRVRGNSMSSGSGFPTSMQPNVASNTPFHYTLIHSIVRSNCHGSPTCITPLSTSETAFVVSYTDAAVLVYDTTSGEEIAAMASLETYDNTPNTGVNAVVVATKRLNISPGMDSCHRFPKDESLVGSAASLGNGAESIIISGHEDRYIRFYDANSGQCTYNMLAHPAAIAALALSPDGIELVSAGHDASLRFWSLEKRTCTQEITSHRLMRGEGVCSVSWSKDGRWVVSAGGDGIVKVFAR